MTHRQHLLNTTMGFLANREDQEKLIAEDRLQPVLVRCGGGRFSCPVQDLQHFIDIITREDSDYVRDVSVTSK
jgi:hypothetical protein